jgi:HK97 family phage prohead protease
MIADMAEAFLGVPLRTPNCLVDTASAAGVDRPGVPARRVLLPSPRRRTSERRPLRAALTHGPERSGNMERKTITLAGAGVSEAGTGSFSGYASLFGVLDSQGDIVARGAYSATLPRFVERGFIAWSHDWSDPVATIREAKEDDRGLYITADFHSDEASQRARTRTVERIRRGKFMGLSIGYQPVVADQTDAGRVLRQIDLFETSLVTVPALADAGVMAAKAGATAPSRRPDPVLAEIRDWLEALQRTGHAKRPALPASPPSRGRCVVISGFRIDREVRRAAQEAADQCADELGIKRCDVRWFDDATAARLAQIERNGIEPERFDVDGVDECLGVYRPEAPNGIYLRVTDDARLAAEIAAHETRHRWQFSTYGAPRRGEMAMYEADARDYSDQVAAGLDRQGGTGW